MARSSLTSRAVVAAIFLVLAVMSVPLMADVATSPSDEDGQSFGHYLADHQSDLGPFFTENAGDMFKLGVPLVMGMLGWVIIFTMLVGWGVDVLMGRGYAFFFAPAFSEIKRAFIYATGRLFLSFVYTCLLGLAIVFSLKFVDAGIVMAVVVGVLLLVAFAAQIVWILYLYRTAFSISIFFYFAIIVVHSMVAFLIAKPFIGSHASPVATDFVDRVITSKLQAAANSTKQDLAAIDSDRGTAKAKVIQLQNQIRQAQADQDQLRQRIEEKKKSDIYVFSQIVQAHARGELGLAHDQLISFMGRFPTSPLNALARAQLAQVNDQMTNNAAQKKQEEADAARAAAEARADLLARAAKGDVTLSEMRQAIIGKSRTDVSNLLGQPSDTASDSWSYRQAMIVNPLTNERHGLTVYFLEGEVQSVDYNRNQP